MAPVFREQWCPSFSGRKESNATRMAPRNLHHGLFHAGGAASANSDSVREVRGLSKANFDAVAALKVLEPFAAAPNDHTTVARS